MAMPGMRCLTYVPPAPRACALIHLICCPPPPCPPAPQASRTACSCRPASGLKTWPRWVGRQCMVLLLVRRSGVSCHGLSTGPVKLHRNIATCLLPLHSCPPAHWHLDLPLLRWPPLHRQREHHAAAGGRGGGAPQLSGLQWQQPCRKPVWSATTSSTSLPANPLGQTSHMAIHHACWRWQAPQLASRTGKEALETRPMSKANSAPHLPTLNSELKPHTETQDLLAACQHSNFPSPN